MNNNFYDVETLDNVFTVANLKEKENEIDVYYLLDNPEILSDPNWQSKLTQRILEKNKNFNGTVAYYNLMTVSGCEHLIKTFGACDAFDANDTYNIANLNRLLDQEYTIRNTTNDPKELKDMEEKLNAEANRMKRIRGSWNTMFRLIPDTSPIYDPDKHPYFWGYNSYNYDTTMLAILIAKLINSKFQINPITGKKQHITTITPFHENGCPVITANEIRELNDKMFAEYRSQMPKFLASSTFGNDKYSNTEWRIRANMIISGRHLDVARLNEKQSKVALKRILGMLGYQILESDKLKTGQNHINTADEFYDLIAYNVSDVVNLKKLFYHKAYYSKFELKRNMLETYPELVYEQTNEYETKPNGKQVRKYAPDTNPMTRKVRRDRLTIDSSSAQFATKCLCPYGTLVDIPTVSFMYPSENKAKELGIPRVNVLEETKKFFYNLYPQKDLRAKFDVIYNYYKSIEGKNFNDSESYQKNYPGTKCYNIKDIEKIDACMPYYDADGNPTSCYVQFSIGGIHGAEYNYELFMKHMTEWKSYVNDMNEVQEQFPDPVQLRKVRKVTMKDGRILEYKLFLKSGKKVADSEYRDVEKTKPVLFKMNDDGKTKLNPKYVFTSAGKTNHEDFTSYYPCLLMAMEAFMNEGLGYDRYNEIFGLKQKYGKLMKDKSIAEEEKARYSILREGTKLVLNSASGAADAMFENNIRVNNQIISMRIIGQLFTWRIGQAQTYQGAKIISTNTDGLYSVMEATINNKILEKESNDIGVDIEPEPMYLISKDTNNRIEMNSLDGKILSASGGTLGCRKGPDPTKSLAHPAIIDWSLAEYLIYAAKQNDTDGLAMPFNRDVGLEILNRARSEFDDFEYLRMFQNVLASSTGSINYIYGTKDNDPTNPIILQHYNRAFMMKPNTPNTMHLWAANAKKITPAMKKTRQKNKESKLERHEPIATKVLRENAALKDVPSGYDIVTKKVTNLSPEISVFIQNKDLHYLDDNEKQFLIENLDIECYLNLLQHAFEDNWMNKLPGRDYNNPDPDDNDEIIMDNEDAA